MPRLHKSIDIKAPVGKVFSYLEDPKNAPEWIHSMVEVKDVKGSGRGTHYNWIWKMAGVKLNGESDLVEDLPNEKMVLKSKGAAESTWTFKFEPHENMTHLDLDIDYKIPIPILGKVAEKIVMRQNEREAEIDMQNIKDKLEG
ncbi:MAG: SRPBCC family protein [Deltaproteobacteria bacterium]|nr:SRPBCC family protein [Deltaproteobacteria bacterium]